MITVFSKQWFKKYSKAITWLARLPFVGEFIFNFKKFGHFVDRNRIVEVTPNSVIEFVKLKGKKKAELKQHFFVRNEYALRLQSVFYPIWITFHIWDIITRPIPQLNLGFDTLTVYPDAGTGNTTIDGYVQSYNPSVWATLISGDGTGVSETGTNTYIYSSRGDTTTDYWTFLIRSIFTFDTSSLTSGADISASVMSLCGTGKSDTGTAITPNIDIYTSTPASNNALVNGDYSQFGSTSQTGSPISYADFSVTGYNDFTFNATGIGNISKTGISRFGARNANYDVSGSTPTWSSASQHYMTIYFSDYGSNKPKLVVTYTAVVGPANVKTYKGLAAASVKTCKGLAIASVKTKKGLA